jgi:acetyl esterase/lipase
MGGAVSKEQQSQDPAGHVEEEGKKQENIESNVKAGVCSEEGVNVNEETDALVNLFPDVKPMGEMYPDIKEIEDGLLEYYKSAGQMQMGPHNILEKRAEVETAEGSTLETSPYRKFLEEVDTNVVTIDATDYGGVHTEMKIHVHKVKNSGGAEKKHRALIYFHGGAFCFFNAHLTSPIAAYHAVNLGVTCFGVDYGVAPENKAPGGGLNCYAAVKYILEHAEEFNIDPARLMIGGESSGGNMTACCCMELAKRNESHLVKCAWMDIAFVSNHWFNRTKENSYQIEWDHLEGTLGPMECNATDWENQKTDPQLFPCLMGDELASKCPPSFITTREFDDYKRDSLEYAELMRKNGKLLAEPYVQPGTTHMSGLMGPDMTGNAELAAALRKLVDRFL